MIRAFLALLAAVIAAEALGAAPAYAPAGYNTANEVYDIPPIIAHKAAGLGAPGNSLEAVRRHLQSGADALELDVSLNSAGTPVLAHDPKQAKKTTGAPPDTLEDALALIGRRKTVFLDIKDFNILDSGMAAALARLIAERELYASVIIESFNPIFLMRLRRLDPHIRLMFDFADDAAPAAEESPAQLGRIPWLLKQEWFRSWVIRQIRPDLLGPRFSTSPERLRAWAALGYPLVCWTVDDPAIARRLLSEGVVAVQTNDPLGMAKALKGSFSRPIDDSSGLHRTLIEDLRRPGSEEDLRSVLAWARANGEKVSISGRRHTQGGHTFGPGHLVVDMTAFNDLSLGQDNILSAGSGATWGEVQRFLDPRRRSVRVMQSDTLFTVGGSLSVNVHGWQPREAPIASTVKSFRIMLASGEIKTCSRTQNKDLFSAALGGYGLIGVILDAKLDTSPNELYRRRLSVFTAPEYPDKFSAQVSLNPRAGLAYGRLSVDNRNLLSRASLHVYEAVDAQPARIPQQAAEGLIGIKKAIFRASELGDGAKRRRWLLENYLGTFLEPATVTRNTAMNPDIRVLWSKHAARRDILHEYFVPYDRLGEFLDGFRNLLRRHRQNLLNVTLRDVRRDDDTLLAYARGDRCALVLFFSQDISPQSEEDMRALTRELADLALGLDGSFYLPYRLHYTREQFRKAYPRAGEFFAVKKQHDPHGLFSSGFYEYIRPRP